MPRRLLYVIAAVFVLGLGALLVTGCLRGAAEQPVLVGDGPVEVTEGDGVRIATLNTEFLFDGLDSEGQASFDWKGDPAAARAHRDSIGAVLRRLDADVVMLQEVENAEVLDLLLAESLAGTGYTPYFVQGGDTFTGQDVALLARIPVEEVGRTDERALVEGTRQDYGVSKNLWARLALDGIPATLIGAHFLARPDDPERRPRREAQAEVVRRLVEEELAAGRAVAVLGDLNDFDPDALDRAGSVPITNVLGTIKAAGPGPEDDLRNVLAEVPQEERYTAFYDRNRNDQIDEGELSAIDHVLLSPRLYAGLRGVTFLHGHDPRTVTDHFPIVVTLDLN